MLRILHTPAYVLYIGPPIGRIGLSPGVALAMERRILDQQRPMPRVGWAVEEDKAQGSMQIVVDDDTDKILSGTMILGPGGDEAIHSILDAVVTGTSCIVHQRTMHVHPTVAELLSTIAREAMPLISARCILRRPTRTRHASAGCPDGEAPQDGATVRPSRRSQDR